MKRKAIGAYIFGGGHTVGSRRVFDVLAHFEDGDYYRPIIEANFPEVKYFGDLANWPAESYAGDVDWVYANPPCAPFSMAGIQPLRNRDYSHVDKWRQDPRISCIYNAFELIHRVRPPMWSFESVQGAWKKGRDLIDGLTQGALKLGYSVTHLLFDAIYVGSPQRRRRYFMVAHKYEIPWEHPLIHYPGVEVTPFPTVRDMIGGMPTPHPDDVPPLGAFEDIIGITQPGEGFRGAWERRMLEEVGARESWPRNRQGHVTGRPAFSQHRLAWDMVPPTHIGGCHQAHPEEDRWISWQEAATLGGYPPDYDFVVPLLEKYTVMYQVVLPAAGEWLARNVNAALDAARPTSGEVWFRDFQKSQHRRLK